MQGLEAGLARVALGWSLHFFGLSRAVLIWDLFLWVVGLFGLDSLLSVVIQMALGAPFFTDR
jgi:hypothetical protein